MRRLTILIFGLFFNFSLVAQIDSVKNSTSYDFPIFKIDSIPLTGDTLTSTKRSFTPDSTNILSKGDSISSKPYANQPRGDIETTINYHANDSIFFDLKAQNLKMYGGTHIDYGEIVLEAERTEANLTDRTITSTYVLDSAGKKIGKPVFSEASDTYETDFILYNFNTKRAQIKGVVTEQNGAFMHGYDVKKNENNEMYITSAKYTTCNLSDPHFFIESERLKVTKRNVISGPFNLKFKEVVTPLAFPFGMFPQPKQQTSGILFPTYGEETRRGFFLRDAGYYFAINDYMDLRLTGDVYSKGGYGLTSNTNYRKRYGFSGNMNFSYNKSITDDVENPLSTNDFWVRWSHRPETRGNSNFSASVSAGTTTYNSNNNLVQTDFSRSINQQFSSNISYSQRFQGTPFNLTMNARHNQNVRTGLMTLSLPEASVNMTRLYPFKNIANNSSSPLAKLGFSYSFDTKNELTNRDRGSIPIKNILNPNNDANDTLDFNIDNLSEILDRSKFGGRHQIPIGTSITLLKNFTVSPSFNYQEVWYTKELDFTYIEEENGVRVDTINTFSRAGSWTSGASLNTIIYGIKTFNSDSYIQAIRHVMTPSISFSYNPNFGTPSKGVYRDVQIDSLGNTTRISKYHGFAYGSPSGSESKSVGLGLQNNLEIKVKDKKDTTGIGYKKIKVFDNLSLSSAYNFAADSFELSPIRISTRTSFFNNAISVNLSGTMDPYHYEFISESVSQNGTRRVEQVKLDKYTWENGGGLGNLSNLTTAISFNLSPKKKKGSGNANQNENDRSQNDNLDPFITDQNDLTLQEQEEIEFIRRNPDEYVDFNIPWNLRVSYSFNRSQEGFKDPTIRQTLNFSGGITLTPKTKITINSGYDMEQKTFTQTRIGVNRDLHCWQLSFNWVPFGRYQSFSVVLRPKSSILQDLKLQKRKNFIDFFDQ